jgi:hypothetical protein
VPNTIICPILQIAISQKVPSQISFMFDAWTSDTSNPFLSLCILMLCWRRCTSGGFIVTHLPSHLFKAAIPTLERYWYEQLTAKGFGKRCAWTPNPIQLSLFDHFPCADLPAPHYRGLPSQRGSGHRSIVQAAVHNTPSLLNYGNPTIQRN